MLFLENPAEVKNGIWHDLVEICKTFHGKAVVCWQNMLLQHLQKVYSGIVNGEIYILLCSFTLITITIFCYTIWQRIPPCTFRKLQFLSVMLFLYLVMLQLLPGNFINYSPSFPLCQLFYSAAGTKFLGFITWYVCAIFIKYTVSVFCRSSQSVYIHILDSVPN